MLSGTVYGEVHPSGRYGVFSTNVVVPSFHSMAGKRMEVYDTGSDLTVADFDNNKMINLPHVAREDKFETFPCFSADGNYVFFCVAVTLPVPDQLTELRYSLVRAPFDTLDAVHGDKSDTYHSWSSTSRWFVFASKRGDGQYGKPYFCHIDEYGNPSKPFVLPQKSAFFYEYNLKSFNIPDLGKTKTEISLRDATRMYKSDSEPFSN